MIDDATFAQMLADARAAMLAGRSVFVDEHGFIVEHPPARPPVAPFGRADVARIYDVPEALLVDEQPSTGLDAGTDGPGRCRAACGIPLDPALIDAPDRSGLHANCVEPDVPPSTVDEMRVALAAYEARRPRTMQRTLGPSELGTPCDRQIALKLAGVPRRERGLPWAPMCGTAVHSLMEEVLRAENERLGRERWTIEQRVHLDDELSGHGDAFDNDTATVVDWKYTGVTARRKAARRSCDNADRVSVEYRVQAHLYGWGHERAGRPVRFVRLVLLARSHDYDESVEWTERYRPDIAAQAMARFYAVRDRVTNLDGAAHPDRLAAVEAAPGEACKWCPFRRPTPPGGKPVDETGCEGDLAVDADTMAAFLR